MTPCTEEVLWHIASKHFKHSDPFWEAGKCTFKPWNTVFLTTRLENYKITRFYYFTALNKKSPGVASHNGVIGKRGGGLRTWKISTPLPRCMPPSDHTEHFVSTAFAEVRRLGGRNHTPHHTALTPSPAVPLSLFHIISHLILHPFKTQAMLFPSAPGPLGRVIQAPSGGSCCGMWLNQGNVLAGSHSTPPLTQNFSECIVLHLIEHTVEIWRYLWLTD